MRSVYEKPSVEVISFLALEPLATNDDGFNATERPGMNESIVEWYDAVD